jgi:hypothetical protein
VLDSPALRAAIQATQPLRTAFELRFSQSKPIYAAAMRLRNTPALYDGLNPTQKRIVDLTVRDFRTSGVGLEPAQRAQYNALVDRLSRLATNFSNNVLDSTGVSELWAWGGGADRQGGGAGDSSVLRSAWRCVPRACVRELLVLGRALTHPTPHTAHHTATPHRTAPGVQAAGDGQQAGGGHGGHHARGRGRQGGRCGPQGRDGRGGALAADARLQHLQWRGAVCQGP